MTTLTLIRGLPGSGKSTLGKMLVMNRHCWNDSACQFEADQYFMTDEGEYAFDASKLHQAHESCKAQVRLHLESGHDAIVSNTFTTMKEMKPYIDMAQELGAQLNVIECKGQFGNVHNVPAETIDKMRQRWQDFKPL